MDKTISIRENKFFTRIGDKESLKVTDKETNFTKRVFGTETKVYKIYNSKNELIAIDILPGKEQTETVIYKKNKGLTIVIIEDEGKKYKGVAKCNPCDFFNPQTGYNIAKHRAVIKKHEDKLKGYMEGTNMKGINIFEGGLVNGR
ncbi:hypothetical protein [Clostridium sp. UBA4395]|uniref:hypothetical protein n=1 Tax=Clostridium sp. UBA4395 TaxID=1946360 RepID=UPI003217AA91